METCESCKYVTMIPDDPDPPYGECRYGPPQSGPGSSWKPRYSPVYMPADGLQSKIWWSPRCSKYAKDKT